MIEDRELLREFVRIRSEEAFAELVRRHVDLVHSAALRQFNGDGSRAEDVAQAVFTELARQAPNLADHPRLEGWLYSTTRFISARVSRTEARRVAREKAFTMEQPQTVNEVSGLWSEVKSMLDGAMEEIPAADREAVILRFFRSAPLGAVGAVMGVTENAARMRVDRALEKLRAALERRGIRCSSSLLSAALMANAVSLAPGGLAASIVGPALATAVVTAATGTSLPILGIMTAMKLKLGLAGLALAAAGIGYFINTQSARIRLAEADLQASQAELTRLRERPENSAGEPGRDDLGQDRSELLRLRGEMTLLRAEKRAIAEAQAAPHPPGAGRSHADREAEQRIEEIKAAGIARMNLGAAWLNAMLDFAQRNDGFLPATVEEAQPFLKVPEGLQSFAGLPAAGDYELMFKGKLSEIKEPSRTIIFKEKEPFFADESGGKSRTYVFADGHSEIKRAPDGNFERWEQERTAGPEGTIGEVVVELQ